MNLVINSKSSYSQKKKLGYKYKRLYLDEISNLAFEYYNQKRKKFYGNKMLKNLKSANKNILQLM